MLLGIKTDKPEVEFVLVNDMGNVVNKTTWNADRELAHHLLDRLQSFVKKSGADLHALTGLFVFRGPGSYTGLRIGITVMNSLAYAQALPIVGTDGESWIEDGTSRLASGENDKVVLPEYGGDPHITKAKK